MIWSMMWPAMSTMLGPWIWLVAIWFVISVLAVLWALIDIARADQDTGYKLIWAAITVVLGLIGALLYYVVERMPKPEKSKSKRER